VATNNSSATVSRQDKLKLTAAFAVAAITPGSFILLALVGASRLSIKPKNQKYR
jgi:Na+-translocating ferredoxin:NAD+ oxidoreductase RnfE subunit